MKTKLPFGLLIFAAFLAGCAHADPERRREESRGPDAVTPATVTPSPETPSPVAADRPALDYVGSEKRRIRFSHIEFLVPPAQVLDASLLLLGDSADNTPDGAGRLYDTLVNSARKGEVEMRVTSLALTNGQASSLKSAALIRYAESYALPQTEEVETDPVTPLPATKGGEAGTDTEKAPPALSVKKKVTRVISGAWPQDFTVQETGLALEVTPTVSGDNRSIDLDFKPKRTSIDATAGETLSPGTTCPAQPRFSVWTVENKFTVTRGRASFVAEIPPAPMAKEPRTVFIFVRAD